MKNGYAFLEFREFRDADDAVHDLNGRELKGERVTVELATGTPHGRDRHNWRPPPGGSYDRRDRGRGGNKYERTEYRLIVENLSSRISWQDLKDAFRQAGEVTYADAHTKRKNEGIVEFSSRSEMQKALDTMDGKEMNGRKIKLREDKPSSGSRSKRSRTRSRSRSRSKSKSHSRSRSTSRSSRSKSKSKSKSPIKKDADKNGEKEEKSKNRKRSRSRSGSRSSKSRSKSASPRANGDQTSPSAKRDKKGSSEEPERNDKKSDAGSGDSD